MNEAARPRDSGLWHMRLPIGAVTSILHRVTGLCLLIVLTVTLFVMHRALSSSQSYARVVRQMSTTSGHLLGAVAVWLVAQHAYGGVRHLLWDAHLLRGRRLSRQSALFVWVAAAGTAFAAWLLWP